MKKVLAVLFVLVSITSYSQSFTGLSGYLKVEDNSWSLRFANNEYYYYTDVASIVLDSKSEVETFYNDLLSAKEGIVNILNENYMITSDKKMITLTNSNGQITVMVKKYLKKGLEEIKTSINFMS